MSRFAARWPRGRGSRVAVALALWTVAASAVAELDGDPCRWPGWNVDAEHAAFADEARELIAGREPTQIPDIEPGRLYRLALAPIARVTPVATGGPEVRPEAVGAGLLAFTAPVAGRWRIALDDRAWVDVIDDGVLLAAERFTGSAECTRFHKTVEFDLPAGRRLVIQIGNAPGSELRLAVVPAR